MAGLSLIGAIQSFGKHEHKQGEAPDSRQPFRWWNIAVIIAAILAYALALEKLGFFICTFLFVGLLLKVVEPQPWKVAIMGGLIAAVSSEIVFNILLRSRIPSGVFGY
jgi:predicted branched-subunit amino acid permease